MDICKAIAAYERQLLRGPSRFAYVDDVVAGQSSAALTSGQNRWYATVQWQGQQHYLPQPSGLAEHDRLIGQFGAERPRVADLLRLTTQELRAACDAARAAADCRAGTHAGAHRRPD